MGPGGPARAAWLLDGRGGGRPVDREALARQRAAPRGAWIDLDEGDEGDRAWLRDARGLGPADGERFLRPSTWPRLVASEPDRLLVFLRVPDPRHRVDAGRFSLLRLWLEPHRTITLGPRGIPELAELRRRLSAGRGPRSSGEILFDIIESSAERIADAVVPLRVTIGDLEAALEEEEEFPLPRLRAARRRVLGFQRYLDPQRDLLLRLRNADLSPVAARDLDRRIRGAEEFFESLGHEVDSLVDHSRAIQDALAHRTSEQIGRRIYVLTVLSTILLPLSLLAGLFGVNVGTHYGNVAGAEHPGWFVALAGGLVSLGFAIYAFLRRRRLL